MYQYTILKTDGTIEKFKTEKLSLDSLQFNVGGFIERLARPELYGIKATGDVYVNEDGRNLNLAVNPHARNTEHPLIVGNILIEEKLTEVVQ